MFHPLYSNAVRFLLPDIHRSSQIYHLKSKKKTACIALAATLALSVTAFAANGLVSNWFSSSSSFADYKTLPTAQQVKKDIGYTPILIDSFANGYAFQDGNIISNNLTDENGNSIEKFKSVSFDYEKDGDIVIFAQDKYNSQAELQGSVAKTVGDTDIYYYSYTNKVVPADYELTDADKNTASDNCHQQKDQKKNWNAVMLTPLSAKRIV